MNLALYVTILAGGVGKRMNSPLPKVLHVINGETMIVRIIKQVLKLNPDKIIVVVGKYYSLIKEEIEKHISAPITYTVQEQPLGTGDAVRSTLHLFDKTVTNIILNGDVPLLQAETIQSIYQHYLLKKSKFQVTSINLDIPSGNGRIIIDDHGLFKKIVEEKDCNDAQRSVTLVNCGIYICCSDILVKYIPKIKCNNAQGEYYLTDLVKIYRNNKNAVDLFILSKDKEIEIYNINTTSQLDYAIRCTQQECMCQC